MGPLVKLNLAQKRWFRTADSTQHPQYLFTSTSFEVVLTSGEISVASQFEFNESERLVKAVVETQEFVFYFSPDYLCIVRGTCFIPGPPLSLLQLGAGPGELDYRAVVPEAINGEGAVSLPSFDLYHTQTIRLYCGRRVGQVGYSKRCGLCDGRCGPTNGCQCKACASICIPSTTPTVASALPSPSSIASVAANTGHSFGAVGHSQHPAASTSSDASAAASTGQSFGAVGHSLHPDSVATTHSLGSSGYHEQGMPKPQFLFGEWWQWVAAPYYGHVLLFRSLEYSTDFERWNHVGQCSFGNYRRNYMVINHFTIPVQCSFQSAKWEKRNRYDYNLIPDKLLHFAVQGGGRHVIIRPTCNRHFFPESTDSTYLLVGFGPVTTSREERGETNTGYYHLYARQDRMLDYEKAKSGSQQKHSNDTVFSDDEGGGGWDGGGDGDGDVDGDDPGGTDDADADDAGETGLSDADDAGDLDYADDDGGDFDDVLDNLDIGDADGGGGGDFGGADYGGDFGGGDYGGDFG